MKNKKKLLLGVAAMGLVAVATGAVSTVAWYTASASRSITAGNDLSNSTLATGATATAVQNLYVTVSIATEDTVALTTNDGYAMGIVNGKCVAGTDDANTLFGVATLTVNAYTTWSDDNSNSKIDDGELSGTPTAEDYGRLTAGTKSVQIAAGTRTRVAAYDGEHNTKTSRSDFAAHTWIYTTANPNYVAITLTINASQSTKDAALQLAASSVCFSISGDAANSAYSAVNNQEIAAEGAVNSIKGTLTSHIV